MYKGMAGEGSLTERLWVRTNVTARRRVVALALTRLAQNHCSRQTAILSDEVGMTSCIARCCGWIPIRRTGGSPFVESCRRGHRCPGAGREHVTGRAGGLVFLGADRGTFPRPPTKAVRQASDGPNGSGVERT